MLPSNKAITLFIGLLCFHSIFLSSGYADETDPPKSKVKPKSIYKIDPWIDGSIIFTHTAFTLVAYGHPDLFIHKTCPCNPDDVNPLDRGAIYNDRPAFYSIASATVLAAATVPIVVDYTDLGWSKEFREDLAVFAEVLAVDQGFTSALKFSIQRPFPHRYHPDNHYASDPGDFIAFPSGHTSTVAAVLTASAMTHDLRYGASLWPWAVAGVATTAVGFEMVHSGEHFTTDVLVGALIGTAIGLTVPLLHARTSNTTLISIAPALQGAQLIYEYRI